MKKDSGRGLRISRNARGLLFQQQRYLRRTTPVSDNTELRSSAMLRKTSHFFLSGMCRAVIRRCANFPEECARRIFRIQKRENRNVQSCLSEIWPTGVHMTPNRLSTLHLLSEKGAPYWLRGITMKIFSAA